MVGVGGVGFGELGGTVQFTTTVAALSCLDLQHKVGQSKPLHLIKRNSITAF
jgi:hypothetical protein